jgi:haloalkane dehalogenase
LSALVTTRRAYADVGGRQLHYRWAGNTSRPPLVLLHQSPSTSAMYEPLMACLADRFYLLAPDTPGFGSSDCLPGEIHAQSIEDYATAIHALLDTLGALPCYLFGHHTGAAIAVAMEHAFPGAARAMALSGPTLLDEGLKRELPMLASTITLEEDGSHLQAMWQRIRQKDPEAPLLLSQREMQSAFSSGDAYEASYRAVARQDFADQLATIACPALVFAGSEDPLHHAVAPTVERLPRGVAAELPGGERTYLCERQAETVAAKLTEFFSNCGT